MEVTGSALESLLTRLSASIDSLADVDLEPATIPYTLAQLLEIAIEHRASLLHLNVGSPPILRIDDQLVPIGEQPINRSDCKSLLYPVLSREQRQELYLGNEVDTCFPAAGTGFRLNLYLERGSIGASIRRLRPDIPRLDSLGLASHTIEQVLAEVSGLVLLTGTPRCGKINTLAAMISHINTHRMARIISLEKPVQFWHPNKRSTVIQREIGTDTESFAHGVQQAVLQDPDVLALTELPDRETAEFAIRAAAGGHLVIAVIDASSSVRVLERLLSTFQGAGDDKVVSTLAEALRLVVCQTLVRRSDGRGMIPAFELLVNTEDVRRRIRGGQLDDLPWVMRSSGMQTLGRCLAHMVSLRAVSQEEALRHVGSADELESSHSGADEPVVAASVPEHESGVGDDETLMAFL